MSIACATRRIWIDRFRGEGTRLLFGLDNAPREKAKDILKYCSGSWNSTNEDGERFQDNFRGYIEPSQVEAAVAMLLGVFPEDIFVTPSGGDEMRRKYGHQRLAYAGKTILAGERDLFGENALWKEFLDRCHKVHPYVK